MTPTSVPVAQPQPTGGNYSAIFLNLFKAFTRASYRAAFGVPAPAWDNSRPRQDWFDSTQTNPTATAKYSVIQEVNGVASVVDIQMPGAQAASPNLPGHEPYPAYAVAPTSATQNGLPIIPVFLSTHDQAVEIATELGVSSSEIYDAALQPANYPPGEQRRLWALSGPRYIGLLLANKNSLGIGYPGHWSNGSWVPDPLPADGSTDTRTPVLMPIRPLVPGETLVNTPFGPQVQNTAVQPSSPAGGSFTDADRATQAAIAAGIKDIQARLAKLGI